MALTNQEAQYIMRHNQRVKDMGGGEVTVHWLVNKDGNCVIDHVSIAGNHTPDIYDPPPVDKPT